MNVLFWSDNYLQIKCGCFPICNAHAQQASSLVNRKRIEVIGIFTSVRKRYIDISAELFASEGNLLAHKISTELDE